MKLFFNVFETVTQEVRTHILFSIYWITGSVTELTNKFDIESWAGLSWTLTHDNPVYGMFSGQCAHLDIVKTKYRFLLFDG